MRRLFSARVPLDDAPALEGREGLPLEGDQLVAPANEALALRPFGAELAASAPGGPVASAADPEREVLRAEELARLGRRSDATHVLRQILIDRPGEERASRVMADLLEAAGEQDQALAVLSRALEREPDNAGLLTHRGALLSRMGQHAEAEHDLRRALSLTAGSPGPTLQLGLALLRRSKLGEAVSFLELATTLAPEDADAAFHLGEAYARTGALDRAVTTLTRATALRPEPRAYSLLGRLLDRLGRTEEAMQMHRKARDAAAR